MDDESAFGRLDELLRHPFLGLPSSSSDQRDATFSRPRPYGVEGQHQLYSQPAFDELDDHLDESFPPEEAVMLDSFDRQLLRRSERPNRQGQAPEPQPFSFPQNSMPARFAPAADNPSTNRLVFQPSGRLGLSQFAHEEEDNNHSSSPLRLNALPSSPTLSASRRHHSAAHSPEASAPAFPVARPAKRIQTADHRSQQLHRQPDVSRHSVERARSTDTGSFYQGSSSASVSRNFTTPVVQGIQLVSTHNLPERFRALFPFPLFNAVQSKCFNTTYQTDDNLVVAAPTGSGKTAVLELAICRLVDRLRDGSFKIVYQAPTKSLCAERQRDWQAKFGTLDLQCAELTGDSDQTQLRQVQQASIIITTPEKWDSMTRKWKDHQRLMQMVKLFLIDEVHILKEDRGATLEAVVSRMKSVGSDVRFIALSATVPNSEDIAAWLGRDPESPHMPAVRERFGEEFRPVQLTKHVVGFQHPNNDFAFEKVLNTKLPDIITKYSQRKPILVFCFTRNSSIETAKLLVKWWSSTAPQNRHWDVPRQAISVSDKDLREMISVGVTFHHAGLSPQDRQAVETGFLKGDIKVICCTSTLAVGVNLPCHMVIIKNTVSYQRNIAACKEYSDLEIMQMLGRAGRPQFDDSGIAVIMTRQNRVAYYNKMISGQEVVESCLHLNLIDHLNAEIGLETVTSVDSARKWLSGTFLHVRIKNNPDHYKIEDYAPGRNSDERLRNICAEGISQLKQHRLVNEAESLRCTEFGDAMARYYVQFETMKTFLSLPRQPKVSDILSALAQAAEFRDIRFRAGEKRSYKELNKDNSVKMPIKVSVDSSAHKVSLVIQAVLGCVELPASDPKHTTEFNTAKAVIFQHAHRLIRCIVDCQLHLQDSVGARNALTLSRSLGAQVWDDSPLHMKQLESIGIVAVRKLVSAGIKSIEDLLQIEPDRIERAMSRNPPFGRQIQDKAKGFPQLRVSIKMMGEPKVNKGEHVAVNLKAEIGFINDRTPEVFNKTTVFVCLLVEISDGRACHFVRLPAPRMREGKEIFCRAELTGEKQAIRAFVMCDQIAGTMRQAVLDPKVPPSYFSTILPKAPAPSHPCDSPTAANTSKRRTSSNGRSVVTAARTEDFDDPDLEDADLVAAEDESFLLIDDLDNSDGPPTPKRQKTRIDDVTGKTPEPSRLENGRWACNHPCKDKTSCKHLCCREGLDKKPKPSKAKASKQGEAQSTQRQTQPGMAVAKPQRPLPPTPSTSNSSAAASARPGASNDLHDFKRLHAASTPSLDNLHRIKDGKSSFSAPAPAKPPTKTPTLNNQRVISASQDYDDWIDGNEPLSSASDDLPDMEHLIRRPPHGKREALRRSVNDRSSAKLRSSVQEADPFIVSSERFDAAATDSQDIDEIDLSHGAETKLPHLGKSRRDEQTHESMCGNISTGVNVLKSMQSHAPLRMPFADANWDSVMEDYASATAPDVCHRSGGNISNSSKYFSQSGPTAPVTQAPDDPKGLSYLQELQPARAINVADSANEGEEENATPRELQRWWDRHFESQHFKYTG